MKKEYYYLIGGLLVGALAGYLIAKNKYETAVALTTLEEDKSSMTGRPKNIL